MNQKREWLRGYAAALAAVNRLYDRPSIVEGVMVADGLTVAEFRTAGVEAFDMKEIAAACRGGKAAKKRVMA